MYHALHMNSGLQICYIGHKGQVGSEALNVYDQPARVHNPVVPARNSVHIEIIDVGSLLLLSLPLPMFTLFLSFLGTLRSCFRTRAALQLEILALRHQISVLRRSQRGRVRLTEVDRLLWAWLRHLWSGWCSALIKGAQTESGSKDLRGDFRQRLANPDLDGADCHAADQISAAPGYLRLVPVEFGGLVAPAIVRLPRLVDLVECSLPATAGTRLGTPATAVGASLKKASNLDSSRKLITKKLRKEAKADSLT